VTVRYSPRSRRDLESIRDFIVAESKDRQVADHYIARLLDACDALALLPERYPLYRYATVWRMMPFENLLIFFQVCGNDVRVGHIRHGARMPFRGNGPEKRETPSA
jgi:plasmid stabilization system protein ParE